MASLKHYGTFGLTRLAQQVAHVRAARGEIPAYVDVRMSRLANDEARIAEALGGPVSGRRMVVVGPGQLLREARYFGVKNQVTCLDIDVIPKGLDVRGYAQMLRRNGAGRVVKTIGRKLIGNDRYELAEWRRRLGTLPDPECVVGDVCDGLPGAGTLDVVASWSVFQHIPDVSRALARCVEALRPGGALYIGVQLWTCNTGHHDIRAFSGQEDKLPLFAHLRPGHEHEVTPSAWLNKLRLRQWRAFLGEHCPGFREYQERYGEAELRARLTPTLRAELAGYDDEELFTVDVFWCWRKPV